MIERRYSWPEGHWDWYRHLAFKHGVRCGDLIFVGGQVDKDATGEPQRPGDLDAQTEVVIGHIARVLEGFGCDLGDVVKLVAFYATNGDVDEAALVAAIARHASAHGAGAHAPGPVITPVPLGWLALPGMRIEIEAVAIAGGAERRAAAPGGLPALPAPLVHGLRAGEHVLVGAQAARTGNAPGAAFDRLGAVLDALGATPADLVRVAAWYDPADADGAGERARCLDAVEAASAVLPSPRLPTGERLRVDGWAMRGADGARLARAVSTRPDDWRWPDRRGTTKAIGCGDLVFVSGQFALDREGRALHAGDLNAQTRLVMERVRDALAAFDLGLDHMVKQTSFFLGDADPADIVTNQTLRSSYYREPAGASTGVPLAGFGIEGAMVSVDTIAMR